MDYHVPKLRAIPAPEPRHITVELKEGYGGTAIWPACDISALFTRLTGTKTLRRVDVEVIKQLGYEVRVKQTLPTNL